MRFLTDKPHHDLTYSDVFMAPNYSQISSRLDVNLASTDGLNNPLPIVAANMTAISGRRMAETVARRGAIAILPQDIPTDIVKKVIADIKKAHIVYDTPLTVTPETTVSEAAALINRRAHGVVIVISEGKPVGIVSDTEMKTADRFSQVHEVMTTDMSLVPAGTSPKDIFDFLSARHQKVALIIDEKNSSGKLSGILTSKGALRAALYQPALDRHGRLKVGIDRFRVVTVQI